MMNNEKHMTLGLDLGIASVGWCLFDSDENENPRRIIDLGSLVYNQLENGKNGKRENQIRRQKRGMRRQRRRKVRRLEACRNQFTKDLGVIFDFENNNFRINGLEAKDFASPYELKIKGLTEKLSIEELSIALYHYMKYRGFKSNRKSKELNDKDEKGLLLEIKKMSDEREALGENGYITQVIWKNYLEGLKTNKGNSIHNRGKEYHLTVARSEYEREIEALLNKQIEFGLITNDFKQKFIKLFDRQRSYSKGPGKGSPYQVDFSKMRGICPFDNNPYAIKDSYSATAFTLLSKLCNFRYKDIYENEYKSLTPEQIQISFSKIISSKSNTVYAVLLKDCGIKLDSVSSIKGLFLTKAEKKSIISDILKETGKQELDVEDWAQYEEKEKEKLFKKTFYKNSDFFKKIYDVLYNSKKKQKDEKITDEIIAKLNYTAFVSFKYKTDDEIKNALQEPEGSGLVFSDDEINEILDIPYDATKTINLSQEICDKLIPEMLQGLRYDEAMKKIGYNHYNSLEGKNGTIQPLPEIDISLKNISVTLNNPVVKHTLVQMRKIINAVIKTYGYPTSYSVELARELKKSFEDRKKIQYEQTDNQNENATLKLEMMEFFPNVMRSFKDAERKDNLIRYKLFKLQQGISPYTGNKIDKSKIFDNNYYQVDHILPFSRSFDDSLSNKVLVETKENQEKKNLTPREYYKNNFKSIDDFVKNICHDRKKKENLLFEGDIRNRCDFSNSDSTDTSYIATLAVKLINTYLLNEESHCKTIPGAITAKLRNLWNLSGRVHSYLSTYENNCYRLRDINNYKFKAMEYVSNEKKGINFVFDYINTSNIANIIKEEGKIYFFEKKSEKSLKNDEKQLNNHISHILDNFEYYKNKFSDCIGKDVFALQEKANFLSKDSYSSSSFDESMSYVLAEVIKEITNECNEKNRSNDLHHALDAAIIGCITPSITKRLSDFFKKEECEVDYLTGEQKLELQLPYPDFNKEVLLRVYERDEDKLISELNKLPMYKDNPATKNNVHIMWPTRQQETKVVGAISSETICGVVVDEDGKKCLTVNKAVSKLKDKDINNILNINNGNKAVKKAVEDWFAQDKNTRTKYPILPKKGVPIKSVVIKGSLLSNQPCLGDDRYAENSDVVRVDVYKRKVDGDENLYFVPIYYYQIFNEKRKTNNPIFYTIHKSQAIQEILSKSDLDNEYIKLLSLNRSSLIEIELKDDKGTRRGFAYSGGVTRGKLEIYSVLGDNYDLCHDCLSCNVAASQNYITVSTIKSIKLHNISILGKIS